MAAEVIESSSQAQESATQSPGGGSSRSPLVQRLLDASANLPAFVHDLLTAQAVTVAGTEAAGFLLERGAENTLSMRLIAHIRPDASTNETRQAAVKAFQELVQPCVQQGRDGAIEIGAPNDRAEAQFCLITLLRNEGEVVAVSAVITRCMNLERARQRLSSMQLVAGYFDLFTLRKASEQSRMIAQSHQHVLQLATAVATAEGFESAAMNLCNELATRSGASRVSLGWHKGRNIRVRALSHTEEFDKRQELVVGLEKVMEECVDQDQVVQYDPTGGSTDNVTRGAAQFSRSQGGNIILSLPLRRRDEIVGAVTLEFLPNQKIGPQVASGLAIAVDLLAPQLYDRWMNDRWLITKAGISTRETAKLAVGPKHMLAKLIAVGVVVALICLFAIRPMYHVSAPFQFEYTDKNSYSAPFEGKILQLGTATNGEMIQPGMQVKKGQVLLVMDTKDLEEKLREASDRESKALIDASHYRNLAEQPGAAAQRDQDYTAQARMADHDASGAHAEVELYTSQIKRATITAETDGMILKGDLAEKVGQAVKVGEVLFEVAPTGSKLRALLTVNERDIQDVENSQKDGKLATDAMPTERVDFKITRVIPAGETKDQDNIFKVYAEPNEIKPYWRHNMAGEARINVKSEPLAWIWTHRLIDFLRLKLWM